ncbi:MAG TPA: phasin family protein [Candidatus Competibacteraceae bacterium]|mgnify:FL=1|nr:phasin family protein [Candidatus Competibacteraceae bacterium]
MSDETEKSLPETVSEQVRAVVSKAQEETGRLVDSLVKEGEKIRDQTRRIAEEKVGEMKDRVDEVRGMVEDVRSRAGDTLDNLEQLFEERVARALKRLGVPTRDDVQGIARRLEEINERIRLLAEAREAASMALSVDDLKQINGIGPVLEGKLKAAGICSYQQIAALNPADIERLETEVIHFSGRINRDDWIGQARTLHLRKYGVEPR